MRPAEFLENEQHLLAKERAIVAHCKLLVEAGLSRGRICDLLGDLRDMKRRRDQSKVQLDNKTLVDWEAAECFYDQQSRHQLNGRAPRYYYNSRLDDPKKRLAEILDAEVVKT